MGQISDGRILLNDAETSVVDLAGAGGGTADTDVFIEGSQSFGQITSTSLLGLMHDAGTAQDWSNNVFYYWINCGIVPLLDDQNLGGFTIRFCGATVTDWFEVYVGGGDFWPKAVQGGWVQFVVDIERARQVSGAGSPSLAGSPIRGGTNGTPPATSAIQYTGFSAITAAVMPKHVDNTWMDAVYRLPKGSPGIIVSGDNGGSPYTWDDVLLAADYTDPAKAWGTAKSLDGIIFLNTPVQFGNDGSPTFAAHDFEDTNKVITYEEQEFIGDDFYGMVAVGDTGGTQRLVAGVSGSAGQGWTILASPVAPRWSWDSTDADIDNVGLYGCSFTHTTVVDLDNAFVKMYDSLLIDGQRLWHSRVSSPRSGADFQRNAIISAVPVLYDESPIIGSPANLAYVWSADLDKLIDNSFTFSSDHAIKILEARNMGFVGNTFSGYGSAQTLDAALYNEVGTFDLSISGGGDTPTVFDAVSPGVKVLNNISVTITDIEVNTEIRVYPVESPYNTTEIAGIENTGSPAEFTFSGSAGLVVDIVILNIGYVLPPDNRIRNFTIPTSDSSFPISQIIDRNYSNP